MYQLWCGTCSLRSGGPKCTSFGAVPALFEVVGQNVPASVRYLLSLKWWAKMARQFPKGPDTRIALNCLFLFCCPSVDRSPPDGYRLLFRLDTISLLLSLHDSSFSSNCSQAAMCTQISSCLFLPNQSQISLQHLLP